MSDVKRKSACVKAFDIFCSYKISKEYSYIYYQLLSDAAKLVWMKKIQSNRMNL